MNQSKQTAVEALEFVLNEAEAFYKLIAERKDIVLRSVFKLGERGNVQVAIHDLDSMTHFVDQDAYFQDELVAGIENRQGIVHVIFEAEISVDPFNKGHHYAKPLYNFYCSEAFDKGLNLAGILLNMQAEFPGSEVCVVPNTPESHKLSEYVIRTSWLYPDLYLIRMEGDDKWREAIVVADNKVMVRF